MQPSPFALPDHRIVALSGRDAVAFAHAQFMSEVKGLAAGHWQWSGWLTPKGRVIALFALLKLDDETLWLLLQDADPMEFASALQRFVFRSKLAIAVRDDLHATGRFDAPTKAAGAQLSIGDSGDVALDAGADGGARRLTIAPSPAAATDAALHARWTAFDLAHGLPRLPSSQREQWTPQQLSLDRLRAYSVKKGCYPGQEIVARTHFLGQAKRGLALFDSDAPLTVGMQVSDGERAIGSIVSAITADGRWRALAVLPLEHAATGLRADGAALQASDLLGGLAR
ncbi:folate-binding protein [Luteimonas sp. SX5]|uniref:Folate-binding protein n=1 Tax=Luteimonas galliterrae TaxID=2940486 RepID=A0ABT0MF51_9GAMM|nr:folate-binding protein [Luteimonas galliterrae]MCL1633491.1 folate-binding protein [Luteimonas galliterrae]